MIICFNFDTFTVVSQEYIFIKTNRFQFLINQFIGYMIVRLKLAFSLPSLITSAIF